jgi:hypothetical protein
MVLQRAQLLGGPLDGRDIDVPEKMRDIVVSDAAGRLHKYAAGIKRPRRRKGKRVFHWEGETPRGS